MKRRDLSRKPNSAQGQRAQLRRQARLVRKTPLAPGRKDLQRKAVARVKGLAQRSARTSKFYAEERVPFVRVWLQRYPLCEAQLDGCQQRSRVVHETWTRARAGKPNAYLVPRRAPAGSTPERIAAVWEQNRRQFLALCDACHAWIHAHPKQAQETFITREGVRLRLLRRSLEE